MFSELFAMYHLVAKHIANITRILHQVKLRSGRTVPQIPLRSVDYSSPPSRLTHLSS